MAEETFIQAFWTFKAASRFSREQLAATGVPHNIKQVPCTDEEGNPVLGYGVFKPEHKPSAELRYFKNIGVASITVGRKNISAGSVVSVTADEVAAYEKGINKLFLKDVTAEFLSQHTDKETGEYVATSKLEVVEESELEKVPVLQMKKRREFGDDDD